MNKDLIALLYSIRSASRSVLGGSAMIFLATLVSNSASLKQFFDKVPWASTMMNIGLVYAVVAALVSSGLFLWAGREIKHEDR